MHANEVHICASSIKAANLLQILLCAESGVVDEAIQPSMLLDRVCNTLVDRRIVCHIQLLDMEFARCTGPRSIVGQKDRSPEGLFIPC